MNQVKPVEDEIAASYADRLLEDAHLAALHMKETSGGDIKWKSLQQKLCDVYVDALEKQPSCQNVHSTSHLLAKLVKQEQLNTLIVNLFPGNEGYSLMLRGRNGVETETVRLPYEESELLDYIDAEKLPPLLVDLLDRAQASLFHSGHVIAEVRDYRRSVNNLYSSQYVLLQPTMHTLLCDINAMTSDAPHWTTEDKLALESQLLLHTSEPLCLDPSPAVFLATARLNYNKQKLNINSLKRCAKRSSQAALNRARKMALCVAPKHLKLYDFITHRRSKLSREPPVNLKLGVKPPIDPWKKVEVQLTTPETIDVQKYARALDRPRLTGDHTPVVREEYTFESERSQGRVNIAWLVIMQRQSDDCYFGSLYIDRDFKDAQDTTKGSTAQDTSKGGSAIDSSKGGAAQDSTKGGPPQDSSKGSTCTFCLGTEANVEKYVRQFREIFTEEGRRQVKITHSVPGRQPAISYTAVLHGAPSSAGGAGASSQPPGSGSVQQPIPASMQAPGETGIGSSKQQQFRMPLPGNMTSSAQLTGDLNLLPSGATPGVSVAQVQSKLLQQQQLVRPKSNLPGYMPVSSQLSINSSNVPPGGVGSTLLPGAGTANTGHIHNVGGVLGASHLSIQGSPTLTSGLQQGIGVAGSTQLGQNNLHVGAVQHVAAQQLPSDSSSQTGGRSAWTNQNIAQNSMQLASVNTMGSPNLNIANLTGLQGNVNMQGVNRIHASGPVQVGGVGQRTFVAMVSSPSAFGSSPGSAMLTSPTHSESPFAMAVGAAGQQFLTPTGGPMGNIRGVANEQLLLTRSLQGLGQASGTSQLLQQASGPIHIQTANMSSPGTQMMSPTAVSPFHSLSSGQSQLVHQHQQMMSPVSANAGSHPSLAGFQIPPGALAIQQQPSLMGQLPPPGGGPGNLVVNRNRRPSNTRLP